jgi:hypothetical protein
MAKAKISENVEMKSSDNGDNVAAAIIGVMYQIYGEISIMAISMKT